MKISIKLRGTWWDRPPCCSVYFNNQCLWQGAVNHEIDLEFDVVDTDLDKGQLAIHYWGKTIDQTVIDSTGAIIKDQLLHIDGIVIDGVDLGYLRYQAPFYPQYPKHLDDKQLPLKVINADTFGFNGQYVLEFTVPFYLWYLENQT